ncbi:dockerin type I domain-containing protein [Deinococcus hohokamensis]|uniref:Dockerin type I domain-containing protein n=1 Tax=Deinococcus hohokamensis TaxID=309883 RepID=A0ABV9IAE4_9DEIO
MSAGLLAALLVGTASAATIKLRPQGAEMLRQVQAAIAALSTKELPVTLDTGSGPVLVLGGAAPFNPDVAARVVVVGTERRIEFNPQGPLPLADAVRAELARELGLSAWTPAAARTRLSGADLNGDGKIDLSDLALLMNNYGKTGVTVGDLNQDRKVDDADLQLFSSQYKP